MVNSIVVSTIVSTVQAGTPLALAALGELIAERAGVLNLGVEGMMLMGAVAGFIAAVATGSPMVGLLVAILAGAFMALLFAFITQHLIANQVATGLALTIFGTGLSAFIGKSYTGISLTAIPSWHIPVLSDLPFVGKILFSYDPLVYVSWLAALAIYGYLYHTRSGLKLRAVGESPHVAHALGYPVVRMRYLAIMFGGALSGLGGAYLSLVYTPLWQEGMVAGRGWIALALVVFATWRPGLVLVGAYLFGFLTVFQYQGQAMGIGIPPDFLAMLPYLITIVALVFISMDRTRVLLNTPVSLGKPFHPTN
ncbi:MAG TPA: ABC transporter permease [Burkholderiaceae bacterium]|nr:ABC transporter permease [Burkholderiaceae bacterium]